MSDVDDGQPLQISSSSSRRRRPSREVVRADDSEAIPALVQKARREREEQERKRERDENLEIQWSHRDPAQQRLERRAAEIFQQQRTHQTLAWVENRIAWELYERARQCWAENVKNHLWNLYQQTQMDNAYRQAEREQGH
jgi:hypothetical protein